MPTLGSSGAVWRTSSRSDAKRACVEVAAGPDQVGVRDSKDRSGPALVFPSGAWRAFVRELRAGGFES
jgi:hypothetical protein